MEIITTADNRRIIVKAIADHLGESSVYLGPPTFAYQVGCAKVDRDGKVIVEDAVKGEEIRKVLVREGLAKDTEGWGDAARKPEDTVTAIHIPLDGMEARGVQNILNLLHSKQYLINRSIGADGFHVNSDALKLLESANPTTGEEAVKLVQGMGSFGRGFDFTEDSLRFTGFPYTTDTIQMKAYAELAAMMVAQAKTQKRISPKETIEENEKYYMRIWLIRLGLGGRGGKETRRELLKNLKGHTAFRTEAEKIKWKERQKARNETKRAAENALEEGISKSGEDGRG